MYSTHFGRARAFVQNPNLIIPVQKWVFSNVVAPVAVLPQRGGLLKIYKKMAGNSSLPEKYQLLIFNIATAPETSFADKKELLEILAASASSAQVQEQVWVLVRDPLFQVPILSHLAENKFLVERLVTRISESIEWIHASHDRLKVYQAMSSNIKFRSWFENYFFSGREGSLEPARDPACNANSPEFRQILVNLVQNPETSRVTLGKIVSLVRRIEKEEERKAILKKVMDHPRLSLSLISSIVHCSEREETNPILERMS